MKYEGINLNEKKRVIECTKCKNEEFNDDAEYCRICGSGIYNYCTGEVRDDMGNFEGLCKHKNEGNARFCEKCGNPTEFLKEGILQPYDKLNIESIDDTDDLPF